MSDAMPFRNHRYVMTLRDRRKAEKMTQVAVAESLRAGAEGVMVDRSTVSRWENGERQVDQAAVPGLASLFKLSARTPEAVEAEYGPYWQEGEAGYEGSLHRIERLMEKARRLVEEASRLSPGLFHDMGEHHFFVSTTTTVLPLLLAAKETDDVFRIRARAIRNRAISLMIVPDAALLAKLSEYGYDDLPDFVGDYDAFRRRLVAALTGGEYGDRMTGRQAVAHADQYMGLIEWGEFPHTPGEMTVSLFGRRDPARLDVPAQTRIIIRGILGCREGLQLLPASTDQLQERRLRKFVRTVCGRKHPRASAHLITALGNRISGRPDNSRRRHPHDLSR